MRNKKSKSAADDFHDDKSGRVYLGGGDYSQISNILRGEQNMWDIGNLRYLAMEKVTLSGTFQTQPRLEEERNGRDY